MLCVLALLLTKWASGQEWVVQKANLATIVIGVSFVNSTTGYVPADQNGIGPVFLKSEDGGDSWSPIPHSGYDFLPMGIACSIRESNGAVNGVAGGFGISTQATGIEYTIDGNSWDMAPVDDVFTESQDVEIIHGGGGSWFAIPGQFAVGPPPVTPDQQTNGVAVSIDGGVSWTNYDVGFPEPLARYGSFPSTDTWFVAAGNFPTDQTGLRFDPPCVAPHKLLNHRTCLREGKKIEFASAGKKRAPIRQLAQDSGYSAAIAKTSDGGQTWTTVYSNNTFYFNGMDCITGTQCWAVGESENDSAAPGVRIISTVDGGSTWDIQYYNPDSTLSLTDVQFINSKEGWACGGRQGFGDFNSFFLYTTDGGSTWTEMDNELKGQYCFGMNLVPGDSTTPGSQYLGWASAIGASQSSILNLQW